MAGGWATSDRLAAAVLVDDSVAQVVWPGSAESLGGSFSTRGRCGECCNPRRGSGGLRPSVRFGKRAERPLVAERYWAVATVPSGSVPGFRPTRSRRCTRLDAGCAAPHPAQHPRSPTSCECSCISLQELDRIAPVPSLGMIEPGRLGHRADAPVIANCPLSLMIWGFCSRAAPDARDRVIGTCRQCADNVDASGAPPAGPHWQIGGGYGVVGLPGRGHRQERPLCIGRRRQRLADLSDAASNEEAALRKLVDWAKAHQPRWLLINPAAGWRCYSSCAGSAEVRIGYLHGLAMARAGDLYAGESETDPKDAFLRVRINW